MNISPPSEHAADPPTADRWVRPLAGEEEVGFGAMFLKIIPLILASLLLGAHFLRGNSTILVGVSVLAPLLLLIKKRWILLLVQGLAYVGALVWVHTTFVLVQQRMMVGAPWLRMFLILSGVTALTLYAGYLLNSDVIKQHYQ